MKLKVLLSTCALILISIISKSQTLHSDNYLHSVFTFPKFVAEKGNKTYSLTVDMEQGAEGYWGLNENSVVKNYLSLEGLTLTENNPDFKVDVKLYRRKGMETASFNAEKKYYMLTGATPIQYKITDSKGKVLLNSDKEDINNSFNFESSSTADFPLRLKYHIVGLLTNMAQDIKSNIDYGSLSLKSLTSYNLKKDNPDYMEYVDHQNNVNIVLSASIHAPGKILSSDLINNAVKFWKVKFYSTPDGERKVKNIKLLTSYNIASMYAFDGNIDSAVKWMELSKLESTYKIPELSSFINFQKDNINNYQPLKNLNLASLYNTGIKKANMEVATSRSFHPKAGQGFVEETIAHGLSGAIYKNGKQTDGEFIPMANKPFDPAFIRFMPKGEKVIKLVTSFLADSVNVEGTWFFTAGLKFGEMIFDNSKIRILYDPSVLIFGGNTSAVYYCIKKKNNQKETFTVYMGRMSKFIPKLFSDCPYVLKQLEEGSYEKKPVKEILLKASADYTQNCN
ncbi:MAG: hypothetical protein JWQ25_2429 [Daejeonella sp.]|nr:hypothetical protein [Daejeonella sp.]